VLDPPVILGDDLMTSATPDEEKPSIGPDEGDPYAAPTSPVATGADPPRPGLGRSSWRGAKLGMRGVAYVAGPIAGLFATLCFALTAFAGGTGRGWAIPLYSMNTVSFFVACEILGATFGALIGLLGGLYRRVRPSARSPKPEARRTVAADSFPSPGSFWPWLVSTLAVLALVSAFGTGYSLGWSLDRRLERATAAADRDDPNWRINDLMAAREKVPDAENSAWVVGEALSHLPENWPSEKDLVAAIDRLSDLSDNVRLDDATADRLRRELKTYSEAVRIARTVANYRRGRHELELGPTLIDTQLPETQASRNAARLLRIDSALRVHDGDPDGSLDSCRAILGVGRSIGDEPVTIAQLVRIAEGHVAMKSARRALAQGEATDPALARLQSLTLDELARPVMLHGLKGERATLDEIIRRVRDGEMPISSLGTVVSPAVSSALPSPISPWGRLMFDNQRAVGLEWTNQMVAIFKKPDPERPALVAAWEAEFDRVRKNKLGPWTSTLPMLMLAGHPSFVTAESRYHCQLGSMVILLAAERHRLKTGDWPATIAAIDRDLLPNAPVDPFSGQAYRMERRDGQFLIYSVGPNLKDEHGAVAANPLIKGVSDDYGTGAWDVTLRRRDVDSPDLP